MSTLTAGEIVNDNAVHIGRFDSGSADWHAARAAGLGGSEVSATCGLNPWESRFSLYYRKKDGLPPVEVSGPIKWGTLLEPVIYQDYIDTVLPRGQRMTTGDTFHHKDRPWQIANPDGLMWSDTGELIDLLEIKTAGRGDTWGPDGTDLIPIYYRCQMAWYMDTLGLKSGVLRVLISGNDARTYRITPSVEDIEYLRDQGAQFMHDLTHDIEPNIDDHMATYEAIKELHPEIDGSVVQISADLADRWWAVQDRFDAAKTEKQGVVNEIAARMGLARIAMCGDEKVAYRQRPRNDYGKPFVKSAPRPKFQTVIAA